MLLVELDVLDLHVVLGFLVLFIQKPGHLAAFDDLLGYDLPGVLGLYLDVERIRGEDLDYRTLLAEPEAAGLHDLDIVLDAL